MKKYVNINGYTYSYYDPSISYEDSKRYKKQIKQIKEKIKASQHGCYKNKLTKYGKPYYKDYQELLNFLEKL